MASLKYKFCWPPTVLVCCWILIFFAGDLGLTQYDPVPVRKALLFHLYALYFLIFIFLAGAVFSFLGRRTKPDSQNDDTSRAFVRYHLTARRSFLAASVSIGACAIYLLVVFALLNWTQMFDRYLPTSEVGKLYGSDTTKLLRISAIDIFFALFSLCLWKRSVDIAK